MENVENDAEVEEEVLKTLEVEDELVSNIPSIDEKVESLEVITKKDEDVKVGSNEVMDSIFSAFANTCETYSTYSVYILREDDNIEEIINKYKTTREELSEYNDLDNLRIGTKLIIPTTLDLDE